MRALLFVPAALQAIAMAVDELWFHRRRGLPRWERIGHPLDTLSAAACYGWLALRRPEQRGALTVYIVLAALSCLVITKDEFVHAERCPAHELWLHAVLFVLHPIVFWCSAQLWLAADASWFILGQLVACVVVAAYQFVYWSVPWSRTQKLSAP